MFYLCTYYQVDIFYVYTCVGTTRYPSKYIFYGNKKWVRFNNTIAILNWHEILVKSQTWDY